ncbi:hypothetical protein TNCT_37001 [Trichonephila clavata]|uniref:c-Myc-binding protein n=1 Tax=Trichonephila clavata TaxID=2740835 RepID=A0A8X6ISD3_TRICU|nr:hypothetical protein TNCT_37001 [Trichonephila clavata]
MSLSPDIQTSCQNKNYVAPTIDSEREEFRKYLESSGLLDVLTRVMKDLYEKNNKPIDPLNFLIIALGAVNFDAREISALQDELQNLQVVVKNLKEEIRFLREKLEKNSSE